MERLCDLGFTCMEEGDFLAIKSAHKTYCLQGTPSKCVYHFFRCRLTLDSDVVRVRVTFPSIYLLLMNMMFGQGFCLKISRYLWLGPSRTHSNNTPDTRSAHKTHQTSTKLIKSLILILLFTLKPRGVICDRGPSSTNASHVCRDQAYSHCIAPSTLFNVQLLLRYCWCERLELTL